MRCDSDGEYRKALVHRGRKVEVRFRTESRGDLDALLPTAVRFWRGRARWFKAFREYAAEELLSQLNGCLDCGEDDPPVVTANQLRKSLGVPFAVVFGRDDDGRVYFEMSGGEDPGLHDHCLEVTGSLDEGITEGDVVTLS